MIFRKLALLKATVYCRGYHLKTALSHDIFMFFSLLANMNIL